MLSITIVNHSKSFLSLIFCVATEFKFNQTLNLALNSEGYIQEVDHSSTRIHAEPICLYVLVYDRNSSFTSDKQTHCDRIEHTEDMFYSRLDTTRLRMVLSSRTDISIS